MKKAFEKIVNSFFHIFKIKNDVIIFECGRNKVDDNPLAIYEYMKKNNLDKNYKLVFLVKKGTDVSSLDSKDVYYYRTFSELYYKATAKYLIRSQSIGGIIKKRKGQIVIYADHGIFGLKKSGYDVTNAKDRPPAPMTYGWDYFISASSYNSKLLRSSTGYRGKILNLGLARTDKLVNIDPKKVEKIKRDLGLLNNKKKVILYAPTFRDNKDNVDDSKINCLASLTDYKVIITCHPLAKKGWDKYDLDSNFINAIDYEINDLLLVTDLLITDYSSVIFDFLLLNKPMVFYPYDYDEYVTIRNGFYLDYKKDLPGPIAYNDKELIKILNDKNLINSYEEKRKKFSKKYIELCDGNVCKRIVDMIINNEL